MRLADRSVVVIGGAKGIGAATAHRLARAGARVVVGDRNRGSLARRHAQLVAAGARCLVVPVDVRSPEGVTTLLARARSAFGEVDAVINCAAVLRPGPLGVTGLDGIRDEIETNLLGTVHVARVFAPYFTVRGSGQIVLVASLGGIVPLPHSATYSATKFAVRGFGLALGLELRGTGVRVTVVSPDSTDTAQLQGEAVGGGSSLSFTSRPMSAHSVAAAIVGALIRPRPEVLVPGARGWLIKLLGFSPGLFATLYPALERLGRRGLRRYLRHVSPRRADTPLLQEAV